MILQAYKADIIEAELERELLQASAYPQELREQLAYCLLGGGKRLRGCICLAFCELFGGSLQNSLTFACTLEMIHAYSLVHDDLPCMDNDDMRRGKPSAHKAFGKANAVLIGDALQSLAISLFIHAPELKDSKNAIVTAAMHMVSGQFADLKSQELNITELREMYSQKTGALFWAAATAGAAAAGCSVEQSYIAQVYGNTIGFLFQLADDKTDIENDMKIGKQTLFLTLDSEELKNEVAIRAERVNELLAPYKSAAAEWLEDLINQTAMEILS